MRGFNQQNIKENDGKARRCSKLSFVSWLIALFWCAVVFSWNQGWIFQSSGPIYVPPIIKYVETQPIRRRKPDHDSPVSVKDNIHVIFSTDCGTFQDWQTLLIFYSAVRIGQPGILTRIASGCDEEKKLFLTQLYNKLYPQYSVHFTPDFKHDAKSNKKCKSHLL